MIRKATIVLMLLLGVFSAYGQEVQFSQFYTQVLSLNPAFSGATKQYRFTSGYRNQWPELPQAFVTYTASFDAFVPELNSGFGIVLLKDKAGSGALSQSRVNLSYSYVFKLTKEISVRPAVSFGYYQRGVDSGSLIFGDQLLRGTDRSSVEQLEQQKGFFDASAGGLVYSKNIWVGFSALHLNKPNESLLNEISNLPTFYSLHFGGRLVIEKDRFDEVLKAFWLAVNMKAQNENVQTDIGVYAEFSPVIFGLWYRGIDWKQSNEDAFYNTRDAIIPMVGFRHLGLTVAYSYDITISDMSGATGGSHEIGLVYEFIDPRPKKRRYRIIPCPAF
jgi:type IX secretion system PorP/SprF family membrane protein